MAGPIEPELSFRTRPYLQKRFDRVSRRMAFRASTIGEWRAWRRGLIRKLKALIGYDTMLRTPMRVKVTEEVERPGHIRQRMELRTEPGVTMPVYVLKPKAGGPWPAVIAPHGHAGGGKVAVAGVDEDAAVAERIKQYNYAYGVQFVEAGFIVFAPDARGMGERRENPATGKISNDCLWLNQMGISVGQTVTGMWTWDLHRLVDHIETRGDCLAGQIGCAGLSGGGLQTLWAAALDDRIKCAIVSGYLYGVKESLLNLLNCACNYVPHLFEYADMGDLAALIAPRALMVETGSLDRLNGPSGLKNVRPQVAIARKAYELLESKEKLRHFIFDGPHRWDGGEAVAWMKRWIGAGAV